MCVAKIVLCFIKEHKMRVFTPIRWRKFWGQRRRQDITQEITAYCVGTGLRFVFSG
jgi:hypothetical protein